jgi:hypothetical protein
MGNGVGGRRVRPRRWEGVDGGVLGLDAMAAVAMVGSGAKGADG